ncbi:polysaccharide pyruvyl transferase family protein [Ciceribacter sp. L1K22]|uniref:polysaccharide pyruvyl transferase family protein n=1 Tax=Ciceribacter sp. L1K22 TaxID=2820275 RepID=UPI001ABEE700|nr:polysaccharide pyruvyl transferase family protein [Ciceribacter sp. L1K22]MBO3762223.1 polysaccharide pyruvyl transferase family protein [Ciceribacter sp. L1K22]
MKTHEPSGQSALNALSLSPAQSKYNGILAMTIQYDADSEKHFLVMDSLKAQHRVIDDILGDGTKVALIDYPAYFNTGDLLINQGTEEFFKKSNSFLYSRYSIGDLGKYDPASDVFVVGRHINQLDEDVAKGAVLALHGGGSFGDLWSHHHKLREALLERYKGVKTVVFPQSVQFADPRKYEASAKLFSDHGNVALFVRDEPSMEFVKASGIPGQLLPDMAHHLWRSSNAFPSTLSKDGKLLRQVRNDKEGAERVAEGDTFDWDDTISGVDRAFHLAFSAFRRVNPVPRLIPSSSVWYFERDRLVEKGINHFQKYGRLETDRLHGLILAALLSMPVYFDDRNNKYRKLHRYYSKWLSDSPLITSA